MTLLQQFGSVTIFGTVYAKNRASKKERQTKKDKDQHPVDPPSDSDSETLDTLFALKKGKRTTQRVDENPHTVTA